MPKRGILISIIWWLIMAAALIFLFTHHRQSNARHLTKFYTLVVTIVGFAGQAGISAFFDRQRLQSLNAELASKNFATSLDEGQPAQVLHYHAAPEHTAFRAFFSALGVHADRPIHVAEYKFTIGEGKHASHVRVTEVAVDFLPSAPDLLIARKIPALRKPSAKSSARTELTTNHPKFNKLWLATTTSDQAIAQPLLTTALMDALGDTDPAEIQWRIKDGWLSCTWRKVSKDANLDPFITRVMTCAKLAESHLT